MRSPSACRSLAVDLPGHGHSGWRDDGAYTPANLADDVAIAVEQLAPEAEAVVGMSLGGLTSIELAHRHPELVRKLVLVDITPGVNPQKAKAVTDFVNGPQTFASFDALLARTIEHNPTRAESSLRRGILHNAHQTDDGAWEWNYDRGSSHAANADPATRHRPDDRRCRRPRSVLAAVGPLRAIAVPDHARARLAVAGGRRRRRRRGPTPAARLRVEVVDGAGHSIQGDRPVELAADPRDPM